MEPKSSSELENAPHKLSRRHVVAGAAGLGVVALAANAVTRAPTGPAQTSTTASFVARRPLVQAARADWESQIGSIFRVVGGYRLRLTGTRAFQHADSRPAGVRRRGFLAVFEVLDGKSMAGDLIYGMWQREYGGMQLFLSNSGSPRIMHALFN